MKGAALQVRMRTSCFPTGVSMGRNPQQYWVCSPVLLSSTSSKGDHSLCPTPNCSPPPTPGLITTLSYGLRGNQNPHVAAQ